MTFNELNSVEHYIIKQLSRVNLNARVNIEAKIFRLRALQKSLINQFF